MSPSRRRKARPDRSAAAAFAAVVLAGLLAAAAGCSGAGAGAEAAGGALTVRRGALADRLLLTGEVVASRAHVLFVPQTALFQLQVRWMAENGAVVAAGERVIEFDNTGVAADLDQKRQGVKTAAEELEKKRAALATAEAEKRFAVDQRRSEVDKARLHARIPKELMALREWQEAQLALTRAEAALAAAGKELEAQRRSGAADLALAEIEHTRKEREIQEAEGAIAALTLRAPVAGTVLLADHPWEGRKLQVGDTLWPGMTVATLPESGDLAVDAALSDVDVGRIAPGRPVVVVPDAYPALRFAGRVREVSEVARQSERQPLLRQFPVRIALDPADHSRLRPGMSVRAEVLGAGGRQALLVPRAALGGSPRSPRVRLAGGRQVALRLGPCDALACAVEGGLEAGQKLLPWPRGEG